MVYFYYLLTFLISLISAYLAKFIHIPVPFLIGPMIGMLIVHTFSSKAIHWPRKLRNYSLILLAYVIGSPITANVLHSIAVQLPFMIFSTVITMLFSYLLARGLEKYSHLDFPTALFSSVPGGSSQMIALAEDYKQIDLNVVTFTHTMRVILIVLLVPIISHILSAAHPSAHTGPAMHSTPLTVMNVSVYLLCCFVFAWLFKKWHIPAPWMIGPIFITIVLNVSGLPAFEMPSFVVQLCQIIIGTHIGMSLHIKAIFAHRKTFLLSLIGSFLLIAISYGLSYLLLYLEDTSIITGFLSLVPGGLDQMTIVGIEVGADTTKIAMYQLFRILFIFFFVPPFLTYMMKRYKAEPEN